jgi:Domain of unknown function (DUF4218)
MYKELDHWKGVMSKYILINIFITSNISGITLSSCNCHGISIGDRVIYPYYRKCLPTGHRFRRKTPLNSNDYKEGLRFASNDNDFTPTQKTYDDYVRNSLEGQRTNQPVHGCKKLSPMCKLPYAKYIVRVTDAMHCFQNNIRSGLDVINYYQKETRSRLKNVIDLEKDLFHREFIIRNNIPNWVLTKDEISIAEKRLKNIKGCLVSSFPKEVFTKPHKLKSESRLHYATRYARCTLHGLGNNKRVMANTLKLFDIISMGCSDRFHLDELQDTLIPNLIETLSEREGLLPHTELPYTNHQLIHVFQNIPKSGSPRFVWMFAFERINKLLKNLIKNPAKPLTSMVKNYVWNEMMTMFFAYRLENANKLTSYISYISKDFMDKCLLGYKDIYVEFHTEENRYEIHSMEASRFYQFMGPTSYYYMDEIDQNNLLMACALQASNSTEEYYLLNQLYFYWLELKRKGLNKKFPYWIDDLQGIPDACKHNLNNNYNPDNDWIIIKNFRKGKDSLL